MPVERGRTLDDAGLRAELLETEEAYRVPQRWIFLDELPRLPTGKLYKRLLRDEYWGQRGSRIV